MTIEYNVTLLLGCCLKNELLHQKHVLLKYSLPTVLNTILWRYSLYCTINCPQSCILKTLITNEWIAVQININFTSVRPKCFGIEGSNSEEITWRQRVLLYSSSAKECNKIMQFFQIFTGKKLRMISTSAAIDSEYGHIHWMIYNQIIFAWHTKPKTSLPLSFCWPIDSRIILYLPWQKSTGIK